MLEILAVKDSYWRKAAYYLCKDKMLADDLVSEMYIKLSECKKEINDFYVILTIRSLFYTHQKNKKNLCIDNFNNFANEDIFEPTDQDVAILENINWVARNFIELNQNLSLRKIANIYNLDYNFVYQTIKKEKQRWQKVKG